MNVVIISQLGMIYNVYTEQAFLKEVNDTLIDNSLEDTKDDKITDLNEAIEWYIDKAYADDCLTIDVMEVIK